MFNIDPAHYSKTARKANMMKPVRTNFERALIRGALTRQIQVLGTCRNAGIAECRCLIGSGHIGGNQRRTRTQANSHAFLRMETCVCRVFSMTLANCLAASDGSCSLKLILSPV
ncbi:gamma-glutamyl-gamma-aminobutyrate hydrolase family protein [Sinorhizobium meliloti]|uniref:gamma-glutamyl-gamma-aminobutyrate hydrolase family protein n=1 Tax=Rhizobium meliloti TaxID=382 RepID=UPI001F1A0698|nr:gamma-glutamyl-gamma-aminobutyrate hydrolase family protein [Sinorhizobium meliloti]